MPSLEQLLKKREGVKYIVYLDSLRKPTVGIGHLVTPTDKLKVGDKIDDKKVSEFFKADSASALSAAKSQAAKAGIKDANFIVYLASVNFQLGTKWNKIHKKTWAFILAKKYKEAAAEVKKSTWYSQTPVRAKDFQRALLDLDAPDAAAAPEAKK